MFMLYAFSPKDKQKKNVQTLNYFYFFRQEEHAAVQTQTAGRLQLEKTFKLNQGGCQNKKHLDFIF